MRTRVGTLFIVVFALLVAPAEALAHDPTPGNHSWQTDPGLPRFVAPSKYRTSGFIDDPLVKAGVINAIEVGWADQDNNSDTMRFENDQNSILATVLLSNTTDVTACNNVAGWQGCAWLIDANDGEWKLWVRKSETFCEEGLVNNCLYAKRVTIHEMGHVGGYFPECDDGIGDPPTCTQADSVMQTQSGAPRWHTQAQGGPSAGYNHFELQRCDQAEMQIEYDVDLFAGPYADCFDHVQNHGTFGLKTALTVGSTLYQGCVGGSVTVGGRLDIFDGEYGRERGSPPNGSFHLDGNPLASRVLTFTKSGAGAGTATATTASGNNWSKTFPYTSLGTFQFTVVFDRDANTILMRRGLDSAPLRTFTISWQVNNPC